MKWLLDTHVHIYPLFQVKDALSSILENLSAVDENAVKVACLTERYDCDFFNELKNKSHNDVNREFEIELFDSPSILKISTRHNGQCFFYLVSGQQIITSENIEILALNCPTRIIDGANTSYTIHQVLIQNGLPVVAWSPGKWFFRRGGIVSQLLKEFSPDQLAIGDTSLRPIGWLTPRLMRRARNQGFTVLCGSDPLPLVGEEQRCGIYASRVVHNGEISPAELLQRLLSNRVTTISASGKRGTFVDVVNRILKTIK